MTDSLLILLVISLLVSLLIMLLVTYVSRTRTQRFQDYRRRRRETASAPPLHSKVLPSKEKEDLRSPGTVLYYVVLTCLKCCVDVLIWLLIWFSQRKARVHHPPAPLGLRRSWGKKGSGVWSAREGLRESERVFLRLTPGPFRYT